MNFIVCDRNERPQPKADTLYLFRDNWDDYSYKTAFNLEYCVTPGNKVHIGHMKIAKEGMQEGRIFDVIPRFFTILDDSYFSLGQDEDYYENILHLGEEKRKEMLIALRDVAFDLDRFSRFREELSMRISLMRSVSSFSIEEQFHRIAHGGARLTKYNFSYKLPEHDDTEEHKISFEVTPSSNPPTNVHVLIGRNGTGKTTLIKNMIYSIRSDDETRGTFDYKTPGRFNPTAKFANVVCVAFSPFDDFSELESNDSSIPFSYIGLNKNTDNLLQTITEEFLSSLKECKANSRKRTLWLEAIKILESDPIFEEAKINTFISEDSDVSATFSKLSSGHKVVLLIVTCCVEKIEEKSILFLDEPENHLHPPLLSALIHALSNLLIDRNGVAIISTHSPVILQEVPNHCVWKLTRYDQRLMAERLPIETFGASIGALTNEVFGLEVTNSGFHKRIAQAAKEYDDYDFALSEFENHLGNEAMILLRTLISLNENEEE